MKTEQEIVLQKKIIIIFSLLILVCSLGILNIQKQKLQVAELPVEDQEVVEKIYTIYTANEELFTIDESGEALNNVEELMSGEIERNESNEDSKSEKVESEVSKSEKETFANKIDSEPLIVVEEKKELEVQKNEKTEDEANLKKETQVSSRGSYVREVGAPPTEYVKKIQVNATAYCLCKKCCGKSESNPMYGYTASGIRIIPGTDMKVIAVDPSIVALGSNVYVEGLNGAPSYGYAIAADTGSAIKDYKIDLYMDTHEQALRWGRKNVNLYILGE